MRKIIVLLCGILFSMSIAAGTLEVIDLKCEKVNTGGGFHPHPKSPALTPTVYINENTVSFGSELEGFELQILDEDGVVVYSTVIAAGTSQVVLPSTLSGEYEIRFVTDDYYYYGFITL